MILLYEYRSITNVAVADVIIFRIKFRRHKSRLEGAIKYTRNRTRIRTGGTRRRLLAYVRSPIGDRLLSDATAVALRMTI